MSSSNLRHFTDLFYRCQFDEVIAELKQDRNLLNPAELGLLANVYFELHEVTEAKALLQEASGRIESGPTVVDFFKGRLLYLDNQNEKARACLLALRESAEIELWIRTLFVLGNIAYESENLEECIRINSELEELLPEMQPDHLICLNLFKGRLALLRGEPSKQCVRYCSEAIKIAAKRGWTYWFIDSLYLQALIYLRYDCQEQLNSTLEFLQPIISGSKSLFKAYLIAESFQNVEMATDQKLELDSLALRLKVRGKWVNLAKRPLMYSFAKILFESNDFVSKETLSNGIWPDESYNPLIHDARLFNLANRLRSEIEAYEEQPTVLLSGRLGYRFALEKKKPSLRNFQIQEAKSTQDYLIT